MNGIATWRVRAAVLAVATMLAGSGCAEDPSAPGSGAPNLLLVTIDTVRADRLGAYGYDAARTPTMDALAERGVTFEQAYSPAPMTLPAHATIMTGLLPPQHGARVNGVHQLDDDLWTLAEELSSAGYHTGAFVAAFVLDERFGLAQGFDHYDDDLSNAYEQEVDNSLAVYRSGDQVVDAALAWLDEVPADEPFFAWVHLYDAHYPWYAHEDLGEEASYDGEVAFVDGQYARLASWLEERGLLEDTLVSVVADHGEGLGDHREIEHAYLLNEEVLRVPWFLAGPGCQPGLRVESLVTLEDVQPTLLTLLGRPVGDVEGRDLAPALRGEPIPPGTSYAETDLPWTSFRWAPQRSLTTPEWKYIRTPQTELYDRATDRGEQANLAHIRTEVVTSLEGRLSELEKRLGQRSSAAAALDSEELEQLAALGYVAADRSEVPTATAGLADMKERLAVKDLNAQLKQRLARDAISPDERLALARQLVERSPETPAFHVALGQAHADQGDFPSALPSYETAVELAPTDPGLHYALGDALQQSGRTAEARPHLQMALELEPKMASAHVAMGNVLRSEGRIDLATGSYSEALRLQEDYPEAHYNLALVCLDRGDVADAVSHLETALEQEPGWHLAHLTLGRLLRDTGRLEQAALHLQAALEHGGPSAPLHDELGVLFHRLGRPEDAVRHFLAAMELAPQAWLPHVHRADMAREYGNDEIALAEYEHAVRLAPDLPDPALRLADFLATTTRDDLRDGPRAVALGEALVQATNGQLVYALEVLGLAYGTVGRLDEAVAACLRAQQLARAQGDEAVANALQASIDGLRAEAGDAPSGG